MSPFIAAATSAIAQNSKPLNIVYIMTDDHSYQTISCYDGRYNQTPNIDKMVKNGVIFNNSFVCNSISGPSRACLVTGKLSENNGFLDNASTFDGSQQTMPKILQKAGYQTALIGKWHLVSKPTGFDHWEILPGQGSYYNPDFITSDGKVHREGYVTNIITDLSTQWLDSRDKTKPFCLFVHHKAVHRNWMSDTTNLKLYEDKTFEIPKNYWDTYKGREAAALQEMSIIKDMTLSSDLKVRGDSVPFQPAYGEYKRMNPAQKAAWDAVYDPIAESFKNAHLQGKELAEWKFQRYMRDYLKCVKSVDDNIGRLIEYLEKEGLLENTIIVYASDQGFYMGEHGWFDKRFMYEESMRTPLVMQLPSQFKKRSINQLVQNIDYAPTFLDIAGVEIPKDMDGVSLLPLLKGDNPKDWRKSLYYSYYEYPAEHAVRRHYGVRTDRYKLIRFYGHDVKCWEFFDIKNDPMEMNNLIDNPKYSKIIEDLKIELTKLRAQYHIANIE
ncbi:MAG: sulfatase [Rikenellaceae bacterium]